MEIKQIEIVKTLSDMLLDKAARFEKYKKECEEWEKRWNVWRIEHNNPYRWRFEDETNDYRPVCDVSEAEIERIAVQLRKELVRLYRKQE